MIRSSVRRILTGELIALGSPLFCLSLGGKQLDFKKPSIHEATVDLYLEVIKLRDSLKQKLSCDEIEATLATRAILASLPHDLGQEALEEMSQFIAAVRAKFG